MATVADAAAEVASIEAAGAPSLPADTASNDVAVAEPLREDQIINAVSFLTNPKVCMRGSVADAPWAGACR
jgi:hypothetical protein